MMLKKSQETPKIVKSTGIIFLLGALAVGAVLPGAVFACDVTSVTLYIGHTRVAQRCKHTALCRTP